MCGIPKSLQPNRILGRGREKKNRLHVSDKALFSSSLDEVTQKKEKEAVAKFQFSLLAWPAIGRSELPLIDALSHRYPHPFVIPLLMGLWSPYSTMDQSR